MATTSSIQDILMMYTWEDNIETHATHEIVQHGTPKLFDFPYPLYDSKMKEQFEEDFIRHFYTRHIGSESIALFKLRLQDYLYLNSEKWERLYKSMDENLNPFNNIDVKTTRSTDESEQTDRDRTEDEAQVNTSKRDDLEDEMETTGRSKKDTENETQTNTKNKNEQENTGLIRDVSTGSTENSENEQTTGVTSHADDFTRNLEEETPDERLAITAEDGVGLVNYASNITESKNVNDSSQDTIDSGTNKRTTTGNEDETSDTNRNLIGDEEETKERNKTSNENEDEIKDRLSSRESTENEQRDRNRTELEKQLRAFEQALDEHEIGRRTHQSFVELYDEYIQHFQGLHRLMFKDMEKLFLGVF